MSGFQVLILAAGGSSRYGSAKQLAELNGKPMLQYTIDAALGLGVRPWLCIGANNGEIKAAPGLSLSTCEIVEVPDWQQGLSASLRAGLASILSREGDCRGVLVILGDQPCLRTEQLRQLLCQAEQLPGIIISALYSDHIRGKRGGVPAYFPDSIFSEILALKGDQGAQKVIAMHSHYLMDLGEAIRDIDRPEDLKSLRGGLEGLSPIAAQKPQQYRWRTQQCLRPMPCHRIYCSPCAVS